MSADEIAIRPATVADAPALAELAARTFTDTFAADNRPEDLSAFLAQTYGVEQQTAELSDPETTTLLAEAGGAAIGFAQLRPGRVPDCVGGPAPLELQRFYVDRRWHGRGVAQQLMRAVLGVASDRGGRTLWLGVWERNVRAIAYYAKSGFVDVGSHPFQLGGDLQTDRIMVRPLEAPGAGPSG
jgi:ribosomal protein S18 acetylase RimI-like enzyme